MHHAQFSLTCAGATMSFFRKALSVCVVKVNTNILGLLEGRIADNL